MSFFQSTSAVNSSSSIHHASRSPSSLPNDQPYLLHTPVDSYTCIHPSQHHHRPPCTSPSIPTLQRSKVHILSAMPQTQTYSTCSPSLPPHSPPSYIAPASPPSYKPFPSPSDTTLLLAPPPFYQATCFHASEGGTLLPIHSHSCPHCFEYQRDSLRSYGLHRCTIDWVMILLVLLNVLVWSGVVYGSWCEFRGQEVVWPSWGRRLGLDAVRASCVGAQGAAGWGRICYGEDCTWAFTDC
ncbi:hypothetical protein I307_02770 [Cryptococcus deuterogattii 99/473]|uniref:Uncharacterized protein n=1 Tax=Cryptococcus deuterogattii Ram5 TaxID=1296110 RepID=A0A0D0UTZ8_9TREE|nr:hypothetical protein I309_03170 [Cryptococcus deuterogattii LA55]KIR38686.1 hypothetical protein I313_05324 [Cryptococcus deuterogattii Ram5]KIR90482.1 hypothetical protein I304_05624 [Cryptococcus deuterogattii CBS 10090]KIY57697.1 hypothetical protein I307_02770 [Cryptococcus deuterogattii 99/473]